MLAELFEQLPEVGDPEKPKLVFFFDEAHLLFDEAPKALLEKVEQVVRLIRSKGVGVYFVTQNPLDVPESVLGQLGNRVQHALRAFTPKDQKAVKTAADTLRPNPKLKATQVITELGVGEALVSLLDEKGTPRIVERAFVVPPGSQLGPLSAARAPAVHQGLRPCFGKYEKAGRPRVGLREAEGAHRGAAGSHRAAEPAAGQAPEPALEPGLGHPVRQDRPARRQAVAGHDRGDGEERGAQRSARRVGRQIMRGMLGSILGAAASGAVERPSYRRWGIAFALVGVLCLLLPADPDQALLRRRTRSARTRCCSCAWRCRCPSSSPSRGGCATSSRRSRAGTGRRSPGWASSATTLASFLDFLGLQYVGAGVGRLILFLYPTMVLLLAFLFLQEDADAARARRRW